jgi:peptide/nickel transport system substrate-binding protein
VVFNLDQPLSDFPISIAAWSYIYPAELVDDEEQRQQVAIGTGPFMQEEWIQKEKSVSSRNPDYWEKDSAGQPCRTSTASSCTSRATLNAAAPGFTTTTTATTPGPRPGRPGGAVRQNPDTMVGRRSRSRVANVNGFQFQMNNPTYQDDRVRRAISLGVRPQRVRPRPQRWRQPEPGRARTPTRRCRGRTVRLVPDRRRERPLVPVQPAEASKMMQAAGLPPTTRSSRSCPRTTSGRSSLSWWCRDQPEPARR